MNDNKLWWQSKAVWGSIVAILASVIAIFGYSLPQEQTTELIMQIVTAIGGIVALYGRIKATKQIGKNGYHPDLPEDKP